MTNSIKYLVAALLALTIGSSLMAKDIKDIPMFDIPRFEVLDINNDGQISKQEIRQHRSVRFGSIDLNSDDRLSEEELIQHHTKRTETIVKRMVSNLDTDNDGSLGFKEFKKSPRVEKLNRMFERSDKNNDGFISKEEAEQIKNFIRFLLTR